MSWNLGDNRNFFPNPKAKLGLHHVVSTTRNISLAVVAFQLQLVLVSVKELTLTVVEKQQLPDIETTDLKEEMSCLKWTIINGRMKVCVNFHTDTDNLNIVVYCYQNSLYLKDNEIDLKLTK